MSVNVLPLIIYNIKGEQVKKSHITIEEPCFYFYSYQNFDVRIAKVYDETGKLVIEYPETPRTHMVPTGFVGEFVEEPYPNPNMKIISETTSLDKGAVGTITEPRIYSVLYKSRQYTVVEDAFRDIKKTVTEYYYETTESIDYTGLVNFGYTLHIPKDGYTVEIILSNQDGFSETYVVKLNVLKDTKRDLYNDLIVNKNLPNYDELVKAVAPNAEKRELVKRMLLDFNSLLCSKGTTASITKFFYFIGFLQEQIKVYEEYKQTRETRKTVFEKRTVKTALGIKQEDVETASSVFGKVYEQKINANQSKLRPASTGAELTQEVWIPRNVLDVDEYLTTLNPDRTVDEKTGNYHVRYNNWDDGIQDGKQTLDEDNMPYRPFAVTNIDELYECLKYAIPLANKYFTGEEQHITFFGITYSANLMNNKPVATMMHQIYDQRPLDYRKRVHIDIYSQKYSKAGRKFNYYFVKNCVQKSMPVRYGKVRYSGSISNQYYNRVNSEEADTNAAAQINFGEILHIDISGLGDYASLNGAFLKTLTISTPGQGTLTLVDAAAGVNSIGAKGSYLVYIGKYVEYTIHVYLSDRYNNIEHYIYKLHPNVNDAHIDIKCTQTNPTTWNIQLDPGSSSPQMTGIVWQVLDTLDTNKVVATYNNSLSFNYIPSYQSIYSVKLQFTCNSTTYQFTKEDCISNMEIKDDIIFLKAELDKTTKIPLAEIRSRNLGPVIKIN